MRLICFVEAVCNILEKNGVRMKKYRKLCKKSLALCVTGGLFLSVGKAYADPQEEKSIDEYVLPTVTIQSERTEEVYAGGYVARENSLGAMGDTDFMDVPFNTLTLTQKSIAQSKQAGNTLVQLATMDPTVTTAGNRTYNDVRIRGFYISPHDYYLNGVSGMLSQSSIPMNFVERVEIVSGPDTLLHGASMNGSVGGSINLVPKVAEDQPRITFTETFSGKSHYEHALDLGARFGRDKQWGVRINVDAADGNTEFHHEKMAYHNIFMNLDYRGNKTKAQLLYGYRYVNQTAPTFSLSLNGHDLPAPPSGDANFQLPWSRYRYDNNILTLAVEHELSKDWQAFFHAGYHDEDWNSCYESYYPRLIDDQGNFEADMEEVPIAFWRLSFDAGVRGKVKAGALTHHLALRMDRMSENGGGQDWFGSNTYRGNIYDNSITRHTTPEGVALDPWYYSGAKILSGVTVTDRLVTDDEKWSFLLGLRYQNEKVFRAHDGKDYTDSHSTSAVSPNFGVMYALNPVTKVYANYIEGLGRGYFVPKRYANGGEYLKPQMTKQYEAGVKWDTKKLAGSFSIFSLEQENAYADAGKVYRYHGRRQNRGAQVTVFGEVSPKWNLIGGLMYLQAKQKGGVNDGKGIPAVPQWNATLTAEYNADSNWTAYGRLTYTGSAYLTSANTAKVPEWYRLDLGVQYEKPLAGGNAMRVGLHVFNALNRKYWCARGNDTVALDGPRSVVLSLGYDF